jgi:hypothetical protein
VCNEQRALITTVSDGATAGSPRASWLFILASRNRTRFGPQVHFEKPAKSGSYPEPSKKTGQVLVRTPGGQKPEFLL